MQQILLIGCGSRPLRDTLERRGFRVAEADDLDAGLELLVRLGAGPRPLVGVVVSWPPDRTSRGHDLFDVLADSENQDLGVVLLADAVEPAAVTWLKLRRRSALLLWSDYSEVAPTMERLVRPDPETRAGSEDPGALAHLKILLVDDSPTVRIGLRRALMRLGYVVETADSIESGWELVSGRTYDVAIVDYFLPDGRGAELVERIRGEARLGNTEVAMLTASYSDDVIADALRAGAADCIFKSEAKDVLLARVAALSRAVMQRRAIDVERRRLQAILSSVGDGVYGVDLEGRIQFINPAARETLGYDVGFQFRGRSAHELFHHSFDDGTAMAPRSCFLSQCYRSGSQISGWQTTFWHKGGRAIPVDCSVFPMQLDGRRVGSVVAFRDISARKLLEEELRWQATHDSLTRLLNRSFFESQLEQEVHRLKRSTQTSALLFVDLDRFKYINDTAGHAAGDQLLIEVAEKLRGRLRVSDTLARIGGDEYAIILRNLRDKDIFSAADQFRQVLVEMPFVFDNKQYRVSATVGVAVMDAKTRSPGQAMANADIACHVAKNLGRNRTHVFSHESDRRVAVQMEQGWSERLQRALTDNRFQLVYQPLLSLRDVELKTLPDREGELWQAYSPILRGGRAWYEVLLRLPSDDGQLIGPDAFMPTAERFNLTEEIDRWVIDHALLAAAEQRRRGRDVGLSINLSAQTLNDATIGSYLDAKLAEYSVAADAVILEMSETRSVTNLEAAKKVVRDLRRLGCRVALDDFGSGFSSFAHLKHLDADMLKVDGSVSRGNAHDPIDLAVVRAVIDIAHSLGKETVAESVEDSSSLRLLQEAGVDWVQGFFVARPSPDFARLPTSTVTNGDFAQRKIS